MRNRMYFGYHDNAEYGVIVTRLPDIPVAAEDGEWVTIAGANGERFISNNALCSVLFNVPLWIPPTADINAITAWLTGTGNVRFNDWPWFWKARVDGQINLMPCTFNDGWTATVVFRAKPHRYMWPEAEDFSIVNSGEFIKGEGTAEADPLIEVTGSGDVTIMIGGSTIMIDGMASAITIDCEAKIAYSGETLKTDQVAIVDAVWPTLSPERTMVSWTGNVSKIRITPRWRNR